MTKLLFPMINVGISQGSFGSFSHQGQAAIDTAGKDTSAEDFLASAPGVITYGDSNETWMKFDGEIEDIDGNKYTNVHMGAFHSPLDKDKKVGQRLGLLEDYSNEGKEGNATGNHKHVVLTQKNIDWSYKSNMIPEKFLFLKRGVHNFIYNKSQYPLFWISDPRNEYVDQLQVLNNALRIRKTPSLKGTIIGHAEKGYWTFTETKQADGYTWYKVYNDMWIAEVEGTSKLVKAKPPKPDPKPIEELPKEPTKATPEPIKEDYKLIWECPKDGIYKIKAAKGQKLFIKGE